MYIGVDIGGTNLVAGLVDDECRIVEKVKTRADKSVGDRALLNAVADLCFEVTAKGGLKPEDIRRIGIGTPGSVDSENGIIIFAGNLPFSSTPAVSMMKERWDCPVYLGNDANAAALGEVYAGAAKGCSSALLVTLGTGIGGGIIIDRRIYAGFNGAAGEIGHMVIVADGELCTCGRRGCWEAYGSATGLIRMTREAMDNNKDSAMWDIIENGHVSGKTAFIAARAGDAAGRAVVDTYIKYLGAGLTNMINILQPEMVCIGGGVCNEGDYLLEPLIGHARREQFKTSGRMTEIRVAELGNDAGVIGAAMLGGE